MSKESLIFIEHIIQNIEDIDSFMKGVSKDELRKNKEKLNAIVRSIEIIGEAAKNLPESFKNKYPEIPWKNIIGTRDLMIHRYFGVDLDSVWNIIKKDLPELKVKILKIKEAMEKSNENSRT
jgi:uncharacterized protein with HEPN domain